MTKDEIKARLQYQRAIYKIHECDDPELKKHFADIIKAYEADHPKQPTKPTGCTPTVPQQATR